MASIRKTVTGNGTKYQVQVRRKGRKPVYRSFQTLKDAQVFVKDIVVRIDRFINVPVMLNLYYLLK
jgi:hypothetical protein